jgi:hypothetical protein
MRLLSLVGKLSEMIFSVDPFIKSGITFDVTVTRNTGKGKLKLSVTRAAAALGVTRTHLSLVIHGHRKSRSLLKRWFELKRSTPNVS